MLRKNESKGANVIIRFIVSYILVMLIVLSIGSVTLLSARNMAKNYAVSSTMIGLEKTRDTLNARFVEINNMLTQIINFDRNVMYFTNKGQPLENADYYKMSDLSNELHKYILTNRFIYDISIYFENHGIIVSPGYIYSNARRAYGTLFQYEGLDFEQWRDSILIDSRTPVTASGQIVTRSGQSKAVIPYISSLYGTGTVNNGAIAVLVSADELSAHLNYMESMAPSGGIGYFVADESGSVILSDGTHDLPGGLDMSSVTESSGSFTRSIDGTDFTIAYLSDYVNGWIYGALIPPDYFSQSVDYISKTYLVVTACAFVIGLLIAVMLAIWNSRPINSTLEILREAEVGLKGLNAGDGDLRDSVLGIIRQNAIISQRLDEQKPLLRDAIVKKLLTGGFNGGDDISRALSYTDINFNAASFIVGIMRICESGHSPGSIYDKINMSKLVAGEIVQKHSGETCYFCNIDDDKMAVIFQMPHTHPGIASIDLAECLESVADELQRLGIAVSFAMGGFCSGANEMAVSYREAEKSLYLAQSGVQVSWFSDIDASHTGYYYPMDIELQLMNLAKMGERAKTFALLENIYAENLSGSVLSQEDVRQLAYELRGTLVKLWKELVKDRGEAMSAHSYDDTIGSLDMSEPFDSLFTRMTEIFSLFCNAVNEKKRSHNLGLKNRIIEYINKNYQNPSLCLCDVASRFGLSDKYLSDFFKEQTGENFSSYVESLRMDRILEMLREDSLSISSIASQSGYYSSNTLYKVFKRKFGISPGTYRQHYALEKGHAVSSK